MVFFLSLTVTYSKTKKTEEKRGKSDSSTVEISGDRRLFGKLIVEQVVDANHCTDRSSIFHTH
jgi:hypothetical protein